MLICQKYRLEGAVWTALNEGDGVFTFFGSGGTENEVFQVLYKSYS